MPAKGSRGGRSSSTHDSYGNKIRPTIKQSLFGGSPSFTGDFKGMFFGAPQKRLPYFTKPESQRSPCDQANECIFEK